MNEGGVIIMNEVAQTQKDNHFICLSTDMNLHIHMCTPFGMLMEVLKLLWCHGVGLSREERYDTLIEKVKRE